VEKARSDFFSDTRRLKEFDRPTDAGAVFDETFDAWTASVHLRLTDNKAKTNGPWNSLKGRVNDWTAAGISGLASRHNCPHADPNQYNCRNNLLSEYEEVTF